MNGMTVYLKMRHKQCTCNNNNISNNNQNNNSISSSFKSNIFNNYLNSSSNNNINNINNQRYVTIVLLDSTYLDFLYDVSVTF